MGNNQSHETVEKAQPNLSFPPNLLQSLEKIVFELNESNIDETDKIVKLYINFPYTFNLALSQLIYASFVSQKKDFNTYFTFIKIIDTKEKGVITNDNTLIKIFTNYLLHLDSQESNFLLEKMIESQIISSNSIEKKATLYFAHRISNETLKKIKTEDNIPFSKYFNDNMQELQKNDWELHRRLIKDGVNPNEVLKIIRNDEIGKLQEMLSQSNFVLNQKIIPSLYEKYSFINQNNISLTDYAAFFGSINCFKHLLINGCKLNNTGKFAVAGGNEEIIHLCIQNHAPLNNIYESAIEFHQNDIFQYLYENKIEEINDFTKLAKKCIESSNYEILSFLRKSANLNYKKVIKESVKYGNLILLIDLLNENEIPKNIFVNSSKSGNIELVKYLLNKKEIDINSENRVRNTAIFIALENGYIEILKLLLEQKDININHSDSVKRTLLIKATINCNTEVVKLLLDKNGIDINIKDTWGRSALMYASEYNCIEIAKLLLNKEGININDTDNRFKATALIIASMKNNIEIVKLLLGHKDIDINATCHGEVTALVSAVKYGHIEIVKLLLAQKNIDINAADNCEETALIKASMGNYSQIVSLLVSNKDIKIDAKDYKGKTALNYAEENGNTEIINILTRK